MSAGAAPSETPEQSKMPRLPAMIGEQAIVSFETSLRNCARGFSAPLRWFFHAIRVSTSLNSSASTPYFLQYAGPRRLNRAGALSSGAVPSLGGDAPVSPEKPL